MERTGSNMEENNNTIRQCLERLNKRPPPLRCELKYLYRRLARAFTELEKHNDAMRYYHAIVNIALEENDKPSEAFAREQLAYIYYWLKEYRMAEKEYRKALEIKKNCKDRNGEQRINKTLGKLYEELGKLDLAFYCFKEVGLSFKSLGNNHEAIRWVMQCLRISKTLRDVQMECTSSEILVDLFMQINCRSRAIECLKNILRQLMDTHEGTKKEEIGQTCHKIAYIYRQDRDFPNALKYYLKAKCVANEIEDKESELKISLELETFFKLTDVVDEVQAHHFRKEANRIAKEIDNGLLKINWYIGNRHIKAGRYNSAYIKLRNLKEKAKKCQSLPFECAALTCLACVFLLQDEHNTAIKYLRDFFELGTIEELKDEHESLRKASSALIDLYRSDPALAKQKRKEFHDAKKAFEDVLGRWKSQFEDTFGLKQQMFENVRCQTSLEINLRVSQELTSTHLRDHNPTRSLLACQKGRERQLTDDLMRRYNYSNEENEDDFMDVMKNADFGAIVYSIDRNDLLKAIWCLRPNAEEPFLHIPQNVQEMTCKEMVNSFYENMKTRDCEDRSLKSFLKDHASRPLPTEHSNDVLSNQGRSDSCQLSQQLIDPIKEQLEGMGEIVIDAEGPLNNVPFAALFPNTKRIRFVPSLLALKVLTHCPDNYHNTDGALVIGGPDVGRVILNGEEVELDPLPYAVEEGRKIASILGTAPLLAKNATKRNVKEGLSGNPGIVHIAAHGGSGKIALAPPSRSDGISNEDDYILTMDEIKELGVTASLVVLSSCCSGRGDITEAGEVLSMCRAFIAAGTRAVIAALWAIDDEKAKNFQMKFYRKIKEGKSVGESLHETMSYTRRRHPVPRDWASFVHVGDDFILFPPKIEPTPKAPTKPFNLNF